jgi:hypothetical protein
MARIFTTPEAMQAAKALMHDITVAGGLNQKSLRTYTPSIFTRQSYISASQNICNELVERDFTNIDPSIREITRWYYKPNYDGSGKNKSFKPDAAAKAIVWFAEQLGLYWDDTVRTPYEIEEFKKSILGEAVYKYGRYISAIPDKSTRSRSTTTNAAGATAGSSGNTAATSNGQPKNGYKQSGPQSGNVRDLRDLSGTAPGTPGQKVHAASSFIYKIIGDNPQSKNTPNVFIKPLSASGAHGTTNKIFISSGNGYTDCTCYFDDPNDAQSFLKKIISDNRVPVNVTNMRVVKNKADTNGYFLVGTEYGVVAISAKTLNEALADALNEEVTREVNWEKATKSYTKEELDELHTWMRRG